MPRTIQTFRVYPRHPSLTEEPRVVVQGVVDLSPFAEKLTLPLWFDADLQLWSDGTFEVIEFGPTYGTIQGSEEVREQLIALYRHAFMSALLTSKLKIIGVAP